MPGSSSAAVSHYQQPRSVVDDTGELPSYRQLEVVSCHADIIVCQTRHKQTRCGDERQ